MVHRHVEIRFSIWVFSELFLGCLHTVPLHNAVLKISLTVQKRLRNHVHMLPKPHTHTINRLQLCFDWCFSSRFIVFPQNERKWCVSVLSYVSLRFLLFRGNNWDITEISFLWARTLVCETCRILQWKVFYRDAWQMQSDENLRAVVGWRTLMIVD